MLPDVIVHKYNILVGEGGGGMEKNVSFIGALENNPRLATDMEGMDTSSMVVSIVGRMCFGVADTFVSYYVS